MGFTMSCHPGTDKLPAIYPENVEALADLNPKLEALNPKPELGLT